jgi:membrane protease YdiL (CAAX protease family)
VLLYPYFVLNKKPKRHDVALSILIVAVVFTVAHFGYNFSPFQVKYDSYQLVTALFLGAFEGYVFYKTKNIVGSIFIHNISNLMLTAFPILIGVIF